MKNANKLYCQLYSTYVKVYNSESYEGVTDRYKKKKKNERMPDIWTYIDR